ncbi:MAG: hypothetical protein ACE5G0_22285 [Rhodothermales bacterium]
MAMHRFFKVSWLGAVLLAALCIAAAMPGGFQLRVDVPKDASSDVVLLVRTYGCNQPAKAKVSGTAEGMVDGKRQSVPLKLKAVAKGVYSIEQQWADEGTWVLAFTGTYRGRVTSTLVTLGTNGKVAMKKTAAGQTPDARFFPRKLSAGDIESALQHLTHHTTPAPRTSTSLSF